MSLQESKALLLCGKKYKKNDSIGVGRKNIFERVVKNGISPLELEIDEGLEVGGDELVEHENGDHHDDADDPHGQQGEVYPVPAFPAVGQPVDDHAEDEQDEDATVVVQDVGDYSGIPGAADAVDHALGGVPGCLVGQGGVEVGTRPEEQSGEGDEDEGLGDAPHLVKPRYIALWEDERIGGFDERAGGHRTCPYAGDAQDGRWEKAVADHEDDEDAADDERLHQVAAAPPDLVANDAQSVESTPDHKVPGGAVP